ncbi:MAG: hypothetical protein KDK48_03390, partial [Chlamydiia bacterium]|nr:hypothetical protein [Chlamydiia bacterium]
RSFQPPKANKKLPKDQTKDSPPPIPDPAILDTHVAQNTPAADDLEKEAERIFEQFRSQQTPTPQPAPTPEAEPTPQLAPPAPAPAPAPEPAPTPTPTPAPSSPAVDPLIIRSQDDVTIPKQAADPEEEPTYLIKFTNVRMSEYVGYVSRITGVNFIFDPADLEFNVTIISNKPTTARHIVGALMQELRVRNLEMIQIGNNIIIHRRETFTSPGYVVSPGESIAPEMEVITKVFRLEAADPLAVAEVIRPILSEQAVVQPIADSRHLIVTSIRSNIERISQIIEDVDSSDVSLEVGEYTSVTMPITQAVETVRQILAPIVGNRPFVISSVINKNTAYIVSTPFFVEQAIKVFERIDLGEEGITKRLRGDAFDDEIEKELQKMIQSEQELLNVPESLRITPEDYKTLSPIELEKRLNALRQYLRDEARRRTEQRREEARKRLESAQGQWQVTAPLGTARGTKFYLHKLQYRQGLEVRDALQRVAQSLQDVTADTTDQTDMISTINSVQWIEGSNTLIFTGTPETLQAVKDLIDEIDTAVPQVLIEVLILEATLEDTLSFNVEWGTRFVEPTSAGAQAFLQTNSPLSAALNSSVSTTSSPDATGLANAAGFNLGIIGRTISRGGCDFATIGGLVSALHSDSRIDILLNPKIVVEDNATAEFFAGVNTAYQTQAIANDFGTTITSNFEFRDVGSTLRVTPHIANNGIITLDIEQEISNVVGGTFSGGTTGGVTVTTPGSGTTGGDTGITGGQSTTAPQNIGPTTRKSTTQTRVHLPDGYFLILSGQIREEKDEVRTQIPCLGGLPIIGAAFSQKRSTVDKKNLMLFIRPQIVDIERINPITKRQQDIFNERKRIRKRWEYEVDEALDFFNIKEPYCAPEERKLFLQ